MAFDVLPKAINHVRIICKHDPAIDQAYLEENKELWDEYVQDPVRTESKLRFLEGKTPTVFICNFDFDAKETKLLENAQSGTDDDRKMKVNMGSWKQTITYLSLKEIENPGVIKFKKDSRGYVDQHTMTILEKFDVTETIMGFYLLQTKSRKDMLANAKN